MKKYLRNIFCTSLSLVLVSGSIVLPRAVKAENMPIFDGDKVLNEWRFDFGAEGSVPEAGYTLVTPDMHYDLETSEYGFLGTDERDWTIGDRLDGFGTQELQIKNDDNIVVRLTAGGTGENDAIGMTGEDLSHNAGDVYYPMRFALRAEDEHYYRVKVTVTTLDPSMDAEISLYTERKHPIFTDAKVEAGTTKTEVFSVRPTPIYYQKSNPTGVIADNMVNIAVVGKNSAIASVIIQEVEPFPVFWVLGDSTVTDGNCSLPFFRLQNYTGVGTGLTKYLPRNIAMVNEGEGGLDANDRLHFDMVAERLKTGDYLYVEYGHNHKSDGPEGYINALPKYYDACQNAIGGPANLIVVSPIERINQWNGETAQYTHSLAGFAEAGKEYVRSKIEEGATNIAYVDLNEYSLDFYNKIVADNNNDPNAIKYYFQTPKAGKTDETHPNDAGAENLAYEFIKAAGAVTDKTQKAVLDGFLENITNELPNLIPASITSSGLGGDAWPTYSVGPRYTYPTDIRSVTLDENGTFTSMTVNVLSGMETYALGVVQICNADGTPKGEPFTTVYNVDNSTGRGTQTIAFGEDAPQLLEGEIFEAYTWSAKDGTQELISSEDGGKRMSSVYKSEAVKELLIKNSDDSATQINSTSQGSFYVAKELSKAIGNSGRYEISADVKYLSGGGLNFKLIAGNSGDKFEGAESLNAFSVGGEGTINSGGKTAGQISSRQFSRIRYILDMDLGTATICVAGYESISYEVPNYTTTETQVTPEKFTAFMLEANKTEVGIEVANLTVAELEPSPLPEKTVIVKPSDLGRGSVEITPASVDNAGEKSLSAKLNTVVTLKANANDSYVFMGWLDGDEVVSVDSEYTIRLRNDLSLIAKFAKDPEVKDIVNYAIRSAKASIKYAHGAMTEMSVIDSIDEYGTPVTKAKNTDFTWKCDTEGVSVSGEGVVTIGSSFSMDGADTKVVTVKASVNGIERTFDLLIYTYDYYNSFMDSPDPSSWNGNISDIGGKNMIMFPPGGGTYEFKLENPVVLSGTKELSYITGANGSAAKLCGQPRRIEIYDSHGTKVIDEVIGYSWGTLNVGGIIESQTISGGINLSGAAAVMNEFTDRVTITINKETNTGTVTFGAASADIKINANATDIASIKFISSTGAPTYDARGLGIADLMIK